MIGFFLCIVAFLLLKILMYPSMIFTIILKIIKKEEWEKEINNYFTEIAITVDKLGNQISGPLFNRIMIKGEDKFLFGNPNETVSFVFGKNIIGIEYNKKIKLTLFGKLIVFIIRLIDPGHFKKSYNANTN